MVKDSSVHKNVFKRGAWSEEEDHKLRTYIQRYGHWNWGLLPKFAGLSRSGKSCRLRWVNYLRPGMKHGNFTTEEDEIILDLHNKLGNKWSAMAAKLPGRSDNEIKNRWNTHLKKKRARENQNVLAADSVGTMDSNQANSLENINLELQEEGEMVCLGLSSDSPLCSSRSELSSYWLSGSDCLVSSDVVPPTSDYELSQDFWREHYLSDVTSSVDSELPPANIPDDYIPKSSCQDTMMIDEFSWSMLDSYVEYNSDFMNCWDSIQ